MSSATHQVKVLGKADKVVTLRLTMLNPDVDQFCVAPNCALQILWDKAHASNRPSPLAEAISSQNRLDAEWLRHNTARFIESVNELGTENDPMPSGVSFDELRRRGAVPQATIEVGVTDPRWIAHIRRGSIWETAPFDAAWT